MKKFWGIFALSFLLTGCWQEGDHWSGTLWVHEDTILETIQGPVQLTAKDTVEVRLYPKSASGMELTFFHQGALKSLKVTLPQGPFRYGRTYVLSELEQNFWVRASAQQNETAISTYSRSQACSDYIYHCGWRWEGAEYRHVCEHQRIHGHQRVEFEQVQTEETLQAELMKEGLLLGEIELTRKGSLRERVVRTHSCQALP